MTIGREGCGLSGRLGGRLGGGSRFGMDKVPSPPSDAMELIHNNSPVLGWSFCFYDGGWSCTEPARSMVFFFSCCCSYAAFMFDACLINLKLNLHFQTTAFWI